MCKPAIGFIGCGVMGGPMAEHLLNAEYGVTLYDVNRSAAQEVAAGYDQAQVKSTPREVAESSDIIVTMLPSGKFVQDVVLGENGLLDALKPGSLLLDTSSSEPWISVALSESLKKVGCELVDAPVSGAQHGAMEGELVFMVGGSSEGVETALPLLNAMGKKVFHLGPVGSGHIMKTVNNLITAMTFMATAEGLALGTRLGLAPDVITDVLNVSTGMSWISQTHIKQRITNRKFDDAFRLELMIKDIGIAMDLVNKEGIAVPFSALGHHLWKAAGQHVGTGSISDMVRFVEHLAGTEITLANADGKMSK